MIACTLFLPIFTAAKDEKYFSLTNVPAINISKVALRKQFVHYLAKNKNDVEPFHDRELECPSKSPTKGPYSGNLKKFEKIWKKFEKKIEKSWKKLKNEKMFLLNSVDMIKNLHREAHIRADSVLGW